MTRPHGILPVEGESADRYIERHEAFARARYLEDYPDWRGSLTEKECDGYIAAEYARAAPLGTLEEIRAATPEGKLRAEVDQLKEQLAEARATKDMWKERYQRQVREADQGAVVIEGAIQWRQVGGGSMLSTLAERDLRWALEIDRLIEIRSSGDDDIDDTGECHAAVMATRIMANVTNAAIRAVVLDALGEPDDGKTPLIDQVRRLVARLEEIEKDPAGLNRE